MSKLFIIFFSFEVLWAQNLPDRFIFASAGKDLKNTNPTTPFYSQRKITFTMGEPFVAIANTGGFKLNVGFIQPDGLIPQSPPAPPLPVEIGIGSPFELHPNPLTDFAILKAPELWQDKVRLNLIDAQGRLVKSQTMESIVLELKFESFLAPGTYYLNIYREDGLFIQQIPIVKMN